MPKLIERARGWLPILRWLPHYRREDLSADLGAGVTTAIMLIPQAMAYAMLAGLPPIHGLYAATVPLLAYAVFGSSRQLAVGPVAMDSLLVAVGVGALVEQGTEAYVAYAILLALMVGIIQLTMGLVRLGFVVNLLSRPVISGFSSAAALIIGLSQLRHLLGINLVESNYVHELLIDAARRVGETQPLTLAIGLGSIVTLVLLKRFAPKFPRALVVVVVGTLLVWGLGLDGRGVAIVGEVPRGLPRPGLPAVDFAAVRALAPTALAIALLSFMEAISVAKSVAGRDTRLDADGRRPRVEADRELTGLGAANLLGGLFGGYPIAGGFSRTAVNAQAGARTGLAGIVTALVVMLTLVALTPLFHDLPKAVLAAIIMTAVFGLIDVGMVRALWKCDRVELALLLLTFASTLVIGIVYGIGIGVIASMVTFVVRQTRPHAAVLGRLPGTAVWRNVERYPDAEVPEGVIVIRVDAQFYFGNVEFLERTIERLIDEAANPVRALVIDSSAVNRLDSSADAALRDIDEALARRGVTLLFAGVKGPVRDMMSRTGLQQALGDARFWHTIDDAVAHA